MIKNVGNSLLTQKFVSDETQLKQCGGDDDAQCIRYTQTAETLIIMRWTASSSKYS